MRGNTSDPFRLAGRRTVGAMDHQSDLREFLTSRRARVTPEQAGLPDFGGRRRVKGLRREEVAMLAGMSTEYYTRLERGNAAGVSDAVLEGVSRALQLDDAERAHLYDLARTANEGLSVQRMRSAPRAEQVRPGLQQMIDAMAQVPVYVQNRRLDAVATNALGQALYSEMFVDPRRPVNAVRFTFLDSRSRTFYRDWEAQTRQVVALLRAEAGRSPYDRVLTDLVGELSTRSELFRKLWASHDVREHRTGLKTIHHPVVGDLDLTFETMDLASHQGLQLLAFSAAPGSPSHDGLQLLATWAATHTTSTQPQQTEVGDTR